jgi:hypothetical protein
MKYSRKRTKSYKVKGACCQFFSGQNCSKNSHIFTAKNRKDGYIFFQSKRSKKRLGTNFNNRYFSLLAVSSQLVQSFKCEHSDCREG